VKLARICAVGMLRQGLDHLWLAACTDFEPDRRARPVGLRHDKEPSQSLSTYITARMTVSGKSRLHQVKSVQCSELDPVELVTSSCLVRIALGQGRVPTGVLDFSHAEPDSFCEAGSGWRMPDCQALRAVRLQEAALSGRPPCLDPLLTASISRSFPASNLTQLPSRLSRVMLRVCLGVTE
jgi:hypothetical protein